ncbi:MAG TPA: hypothetical protein VJB08_06660 [Candidatus Nanoarchaeia archaeon]|nr:hypothetical protein [Candidatus Nanoarchaeia archaeon]
MYKLKAVKDDVIQDHQEYLLSIFLKVLGPENLPNSQKLRPIGSHYYDFLQESRKSVSDLVFEAASIDEYVKKEPDRGVSYALLDTPQRISSHWLWIRKPHIIPASEINQAYTAKGKQPILSKQEALDLPDAKKACAYLLDSYKNEVIQQFCPVSINAGTQSTKTAVPWVSLFFSLLARGQ